MQDAFERNDGFPTGRLLSVLAQHCGDDVANLVEHEWTFPRNIAPHEHPADNRADRSARLAAGKKLNTLLSTARLDGLDVRDPEDSPLFVVTRDELRDHFEPALLEVRPNLHALEHQAPPAEDPQPLTQEQERARQDAGLRAKYGDELQLRHA